MKKNLITFLLASLIVAAIVGGIIFSDRARAQFPPPITGPVVPADTYVFVAHGPVMTSSATQGYGAPTVNKDIPYTFAGYMRFQQTATLNLSNGNTLSSGIIEGHGYLPTGGGKIGGTWRQELDKQSQWTGAILLTFGCGIEQFEFMAYFTPQSGTLMDRSLYRRMSGGLTR